MKSVAITRELIESKKAKPLIRRFSKALNGAVDKGLVPLNGNDSPTQLGTIGKPKPAATFGFTRTPSSKEGILNWKDDFSVLRQNLKVDDDFGFKNFYLEHMELSPILHDIYSDLKSFYGPNVRISSTVTRCADEPDELMIYVHTKDEPGAALKRLDEFHQSHWMNHKDRLFSPVTVYLLSE
jgi:hypothetical protein